MIRGSFLLTLAAVAAITSIPYTAVAIEPVRVMSFNIRYGTANDGINHWNNRRNALTQTIERFAPDLLGTQETLAFQRDYLREAFPQWEAVAAGRDDGKETGEMAALFYRKDRFKAIDSGHFWLSETPEKVGSKGWDAALPRIATWVKLSDRNHSDALPILFLNTHFDHKGQKARAESASLIVSKLEEIGAECRWIVTGDFNADPKEPPYANLFSRNTRPMYRLIDTLRAIQPTPQNEEGTFSGFNAAQTGGSRIDWIACSNHFDVQSAEIVRDSSDGRTPSDHFPVTAVVLPR